MVNPSVVKDAPSGMPSSFAMINSALCESNKALGREVREFILNVPDAKEESITDYLVWKWRLLDKRFKYIRATSFTRHKESTLTGADFQLELWLVGRTVSVPLLFQAKKFIKPFDGYVNKLNYPRNTQAQLTLLLSYAMSQKLTPFYAIYNANSSVVPLCKGGPMHRDSGVYMIDAATIKTFADGMHGRKISIIDILARSNPFHCMFCCPLGATGSYFSNYFDPNHVGNALRNRDELPYYVKQILTTNPEMNNEGGVETQRIDGDLPPVRVIGVYDLSDAQG
jgi:hypothetical protein